jgi:multicomponent Na+:H+ antiporter subunit G
MELVLLVLAWAFLLPGSVFSVIGGIGIHRFPDLYSRLHAAGINDSLAAPLVLIGLMFCGGGLLVTFKLLTVIVLLYLTSPTSTHALAKAAYFGGIKIDAVVIQRKSRVPKRSQGPA